MHIVHQWVVADSAALAALVVVATDIGKVAYQSDIKKFYLLENNSPATWGQLAPGDTFLDGNNKFTKTQTVAPVALTYAASITINAAASNNFNVTLTGNVILANPSGLIAALDGAIYNIKIKQDATGSRLLTLGSKFKVPGGTALVLSTTANATDLLVAQYDHTDDIFLTNLVKDFK